ncbi:MULTISPECIES: hypothetical protein [unclassified Haladaptatus]|uniref:hypothetical protein n=1 Tax=unclassified Haladaptatus TaxID=2622732 RepID=UPI0023E82CC8|nr:MULTISPECIES: hypothetical protein [unclassified Haladaptatus]
MKTQYYRLLVGSVALGIALYASWLLLRGPFMTDQFLKPIEMAAAIFAFVPSTIAAVWGLSPLLDT